MRRFGIARELMRVFKEGKLEVWGSAHMSDAPARAYYGQMGFKECGCIEGLGTDESEVVVKWQK